MATLAVDERPGLSDVLDAVDRARSLPEFLDLALAAIDEHLGFPTSVFVLVLGEPPRPGRRAYAGVKHGSPPYVMEEYFERWSELDALASPAADEAFWRRGWASTEGVYGALDAARRRFVDDFLHRVGEPQQLSVRLIGGHTDGYLTVTGPEPFGGDDRARLLAVGEALAGRLRPYLPRGIPGALTTREAQVTELVAMGMPNRQIAEILRIEEDTVKKHVSHATERLGLSRRTELAVAWATGGRVELPHHYTS